MLKTTNWTNREVMDILEGCKISIKMDDAKNWSQEQYDSAVTYNDAINTCISQFYDFDQDPETADCSKAYDTETGIIYVTSKPLPQ